jgi:hypothetical protein
MSNKNNDMDMEWIRRLDLNKLLIILGVTNKLQRKTFTFQIKLFHLLQNLDWKNDKIFLLINESNSRMFSNIFTSSSIRYESVKLENKFSFGHGTGLSTSLFIIGNSLSLNMSITKAPENKTKLSMQ